MSTAPVLKFPQLDKEFVLVTDASRQAISYILMQEDEDGLTHPVGFGGRSLRASEKNYTVTEIELLGVLAGIKHFHSYLANKRFKVVTDHYNYNYN
jgi:hypothetical protein